MTLIVSARRGDATVLHQAADRLADLLWPLPPGCPGCGRPDGDPRRFCARCTDRMRFPPVPACLRCGAPSPVAAVPAGYCDTCAGRPRSFSRLRAAGPFREPLRGVLHRFKFRGERWLAEPLGAFARAGLHELVEAAEVLVPVPLQVRRMRERGYNQAALFAAALVADGHRRPLLADVLQREGQGPSQSSLAHRADRWRNRPLIRCARPRDVWGRRVLLVDDVFTTGATAGACADALMGAGARSVAVAVLCLD